MIFKGLLATSSPCCGTLLCRFGGEEVQGTKGCLLPPLPILCSLFVNILPMNILCLYSIKIDFETACLFALQLQLQEFNNSTRSTNKF